MMKKLLLILHYFPACQKPEMLKNIFEKLFRSRSKREIFEKNAKLLVEAKRSILNDYIAAIEKHVNLQ